MKINEGFMNFKKLTIHNIASIVDAEIDFEAEPIASEPLFLICGETGAGKSTVVNLLCRFYNINDGQILLHGKDGSVPTTATMLTNFS